MAATGSTMTNDVKSDIEFRCTVGLFVENFSSFKTNKEARFTAYAWNDHLRRIDEELGDSFWRLYVDPLNHCQVPRPDSSTRFFKAVAVHVGWIGPSHFEMNARRIVVSLLDDHNRVVRTRDLVDKNNKQQPHEGWGWNDFISHKTLITDDFLKDNCFWVKAEIFFTITYCGLMAGVGQLLTLGNAYTSKGVADSFLVSSDGQSFPVHRHFLSQVNSVFAEMFDAQCDSEFGKVFVDNIDGETLAVLLKKIYGQEFLNTELAGKVLIAAHKFKLAYLEDECISSLLKDLTIDKAAEALKIATEHSIESLKKMVFELIAGDIRGITVDQAATALRIATEFDINELKNKVLDLIADDASGFLKAGGFLQLATYPDLLREIGDYANQRQSKKLKTEH